MRDNDLLKAITDELSVRQIPYETRRHGASGHLHVVYFVLNGKTHSVAAGTKSADYHAARNNRAKVRKILRQERCAQW